MLLSDPLSFLLLWFDSTNPLMVLFAFIFCVQNSLENLLYLWLGGYIFFKFLLIMEDFYCYIFNGSFAEYNILGLKLFSFSAWIPCSIPVLLLGFCWEICSDFDGFTCICYLFFLSYSLQYSFSVPGLVVLTIICHGAVLFWSSLFGDLEASWTWIDNSFSRFGKISAYLIEYIMYPLGLPSYSSSMPLIYRFGLLMKLLSSWVFLSQLLSFLSKSSSLFSLISFCLFPSSP
jgi:hypothetical protein